MAEPSICILPKLKGPGGPSSFQAKLISGLSALGIEAHHDPRKPGTQAILLIGSTRKLDDLIYAKRQRIRIVQRLDGMNWLHKRQNTGWQHYFRSERLNFQLAFIRRWLADEIVYQSNFTRDWWNTVYGSLRKPNRVIHNGVNLDTFNPAGEGAPPDDHVRLLVVEGSFKGGHERDLYNAVEAANLLSVRLDRKVELMIAGNAPQEMRRQVACAHKASVRWMGLVPHEKIPELDRSAHLLFPAEINAACPNSVVEALASGLPVVSYATGSLPELIGEEGGAVVPYGSNYWRLEEPETSLLVEAAAKVLERLPEYRASARKRAEALFGLDGMVADYRKVLLKE